MPPQTDALVFAVINLHTLIYFLCYLHRKMKSEILIYIFVPYAKDGHSHVLHRATLPFCCTPVSPTEISISKVHNIDASSYSNILNDTHSFIWNLLELSDSYKEFIWSFCTNKFLVLDAIRNGYLDITNICEIKYSLNSLLFLVLSQSYT